MTCSFTFNCPLPNGMHARPAKRLEDKAAELGVGVKWQNLRNGRSAVLPGVLRLLSTDTKAGDPCEMVIEGEQVRGQHLYNWLCNELAQEDATLPLTPEELQPLPPVLSQLNCQPVRATAASSGIAMGSLVLLQPIALSSVSAAADPDPEYEAQRLKQAVVTTRERLERTAQQVGQMADIAHAQLGMLNDDAFRRYLFKAPGAAEEAVKQTSRYFRQQFENSRSPYLKERELDVRDICLLLMDVLQPGWRKKTEQLPPDAMIWATELTPGQFLNLDRSRIKGLMLAHGSNTSHTVILARAFGIPTLVGAVAEPNGQQVILDGELGLYILDPEPEVASWYERQMALLQARAERLRRWRDRPGFTADGRKIELGANIACSAEAGSAFAAGAEGIGLFRTEILFIDRDTPPSEDEQYLAYREVVLASAGRPVIIRTADIGGDKPVDYLNFGEENNPFLGYRAVRIYREFEELFRQQLRAILRASAFGKVRLMVPMVHSVHEIKWVRGVLEEECAGLEEQGIDFDYNLEFGIMLEVPSIAFLMDACCEWVDFFSIGSNDLTQYLLAIDRENMRVANTTHSMHPAVLSLIEQVVQKAHQHGKWVGLCGELGGELRALPLLVGLQLDEISMSAPNLTEMRARMAHLDTQRCRELLNKAMQCDDGDQVSALLEQTTLHTDASLFDNELVMLDIHADNKADAIEQMINQLWLVGRVDKRWLLERDIWAREQVESTCCGNGIALPHTNTVQVDMPSLVVARLAKPVLWDEHEQQPVSLVLMLVMPEVTAEMHLRILSILAMKMADPAVTAALRESTAPEPIISLLTQALNVS